MKRVRGRNGQIRENPNHLNSFSWLLLFGADRYFFHSWYRLMHKRQQHFFFVKN